MACMSVSVRVYLCMCVGCVRMHLSRIHSESPTHELRHPSPRGFLVVEGLGTGRSDFSEVRSSPFSRNSSTPPTLRQELHCMPHLGPHFQLPQGVLSALLWLCPCSMLGPLVLVGREMS